MTTAERLHQSLHLAQISFSVMYGLASFFFLMARPYDSLFDAGAVGLCLVIWVLSLIVSTQWAKNKLAQAGGDQAALTKIQRSIWSIALLLGGGCMLVSWFWSCSIYR
jgi:hypothetical protein